MNLRADLLGTAVRVTEFEPGLVGGTEFSEVRFKGDEKKPQPYTKASSRLLPKMSPMPSIGS